MFHLVARTRDRALLAPSAEEMCRLFHTLREAVPQLEALCVLLDHLHAITPLEERRALAAALSGYTRGRNQRRGEGGPLFEPLPDAVPIADPGKVRTGVRYVHLNPCRARLVADPLAWPWSSHLDAVGLTPAPVRPKARNVFEFHGYVSADPSVNVEGTDLPTVPRGDVPLVGLLAAASVAFRVPAERLLQHRGPARDHFLASARAYSGQSGRAIAAFAGVSERTVYRDAVQARPELAALAADPRIAMLDEAWYGQVVRRWRVRPAFHRG
jgi:hypothetical protein